MFTDVEELRACSTVQTDLCIVGAGAAGISLALAFVDSPVRVVLLENGGLTAEPTGRGIYDVGAGTTPRLLVDPTRMWYFGGNTNHWQGNCRPLDEVDFEPRGWIPYSGWPIRRNQLLSYYERAQHICGLGGFRWYDLDACRAHLNYQPLDVDPSILTNKIVHTCPILSFAELHRHRLEASGNVRVLFRGHAVRLKTNSAGDSVHCVEAVGMDGLQTRIEASVFVLAAGGVENARLLLCSNDVRRHGLGNDHDLVGRFFMEHWYVDIPLGGWGEAGDLSFYSVGRQPVGDASVWGQLVLSEELMRKQRVPALGLWFRRVPFNALSANSAGRIAAFLRGRARLEQPLVDIQLVLSDPGAVARHIVRKLGHRDDGEGCSLRVQLEQTPNPENQIRLSEERDRLGQPLAELVLRLTDKERQSHLRSLELAADEVGLNSQRLRKQMRLMLDAGRVGFFSHHMGTTRMHNDPAQGVVDSDCRVHEVANLFVAGSSVFPTGGSAAPTLTIVALALRLADHIQQSRGVLQTLRF